MSIADEIIGVSELFWGHVPGCSSQVYAYGHTLSYISAAVLLEHPAVQRKKPPQAATNRPPLPHTKLLPVNHLKDFCHGTSYLRRFPCVWSTVHLPQVKPRRRPPSCWKRLNRRRRMRLLWRTWLLRTRLKINDESTSLFFCFTDSLCQSLIYLDLERVNTECEKTAASFSIEFVRISEWEG